VLRAEQGVVGLEGVETEVGACLGGGVEVDEGAGPAFGRLGSLGGLVEGGVGEEGGGGVGGYFGSVAWRLLMCAGERDVIRGGKYHRVGQHRDLLG